MKQFDDELSATESHEFRGINGCLPWVTKELLYPFQFVVKVLQRRQGQARVRDLLKANDVIDETKQHEDFTLTFRVLHLPSCGLIGVSDATLGGVDRFGYPTDQDSKTVKADENMIMNGQTKDHKESREHLARVLQNDEWSVQRDATLVREKSVSQPKRTRRTKQSMFRRGARRVLQCGKLNHIVENESGRVVEQNIGVPMPQILEEIVEIDAIVDIPVLQIEFIFLFSGSTFFLL